MRYLFILLALMLCALPQSSNAQVPCGDLHSGQPIASGYGAAFDLFGLSKALLLRVYCDPTGADVRIVGAMESPGYVYQNGYHWLDGRWQLIQWSGFSKKGEWFVGTAEGRLDRTPATLAAPNFFIAFTCQLVPTTEGGSWRCGCRDTACATSYWQLQSFSTKM